MRGLFVFLSCRAIVSQAQSLGTTRGDDREPALGDDRGRGVTGGGVWLTFGIWYNLFMADLRKSVLLGGGFLMDEVRARLESGCDTRVLPDSGGERDAFLARHGRDFEGAIATSASGR